MQEKNYRKTEGNVVVKPEIKVDISHGSSNFRNLGKTQLEGSFSFN